LHHHADDHAVEWFKLNTSGGQFKAGAIQERFFRDITTERLRRGVFTSVDELVAAINEYVAHHNTKPKPFIWTKSSRDILQKVIRANSRLLTRH